MDKNSASKFNINSNVLSYVNIVEEISGFVKLKKTGQGYTGLCPFHSEKTPSFHVSESKGLYYCFGCGKGGNVINFLKDIKGESFSEVIRYLKNKYNIPLEDNKTGHRSYKSDKNPTEEEFLKNILQLALNFYYENLFVYSSNSGHITEYLKKRGIDENTAKDFKLGFAGFGNGLLKLLINHKVNLDIAVDAGLLVKKLNPGSGYFDRFTNKLIIPVFNINGEPVAFASRDVAPDFAGPKYINTNNSKVFIKNETLFGLDKSLPFIKEENFAVVVEGYFDMIMLYSIGIKNVVATMGTALSRNHIISLSRICDNIILLYDGDKAGINAINRGIDLFINFMEKTDKNIYAVTLSEGEDPDSFIRKYGKDVMVKLISENKKSPVEFILDYHIDKILLNNKETKKINNAVENSHNDDILYNNDGIGMIKKKISVLKEMSPILNKIENVIVLSYYLNLISNRIGLKEEAVRRYIYSKASIQTERTSLVGTRTQGEAGGLTDKNIVYYEKDGLTPISGSAIEDLIIGRIFSNFLLTDYINDDIINEFSDEDAIYIIREIKGMTGTLGKAESKAGFKGNSQVIDEIISKTLNAEKWRRIYYSSTFSGDYEDKICVDEMYDHQAERRAELSSKSDIKKLLIRLKIRNINEACLKLLSELKSSGLDEKARLLKLKELAELKYLVQEYRKKICNF